MGSESGAIVKAAVAARAILVMAASFRSVYGQSCGGSLTGSGTFTSPNYPGLYPNNAYCQWNLTSSDSNSAVQIFFGVLSLEFHSDVLEIYSGGILMEQYQSISPDHTAVYSPSVTVVFRSDASGQRTGFSIFFNSTSPKCGKACYASACLIWTPNFPYPFPVGTTCNWAVDSFGSFTAIESTTVSPTPFTGTLEIASNYDNGSQSVATYRSPAPIPPVSFGPQLFDVTFTSRCRSGTGFMLSFSSRRTQCGQDLVGNGTFSTPNYPSPYGPQTVCVWRLTAFPGMRVQLTVLDLMVEDRHDYVRIYSQDQLVSSYSGSYSPFSLTLDSDVIVDFQSDSFLQTSGMLASFISVP